MKRRDFLRATLVTAGAVIAPSACTDESAGPEGACQVEDGSAFFPQSVASGDPRPDSVILWTRLEVPSTAGDVYVDLQVALDPDFKQIVFLSGESDRLAKLDDAAGRALVPVLAQLAYDHCVKVKVEGLQPGTTYYYRFYYTDGSACYTSRVGRTKTAPADDADTPVRFAYISCQDYIGRYYNTHRALAREEIDFFVVLGDYIYETTGDPGFQEVSEDRTVSFSDVAGAIALGTAEQPFYAARSLSNYRELYRTYRGDPALQALHEQYPVVAIWDDHEYSNDCYGAAATYFNGQVDETDGARRKAANQAWFEFMPVDYTTTEDPTYDFEYDATAEYDPETDIKIWRDLKYGKHLHLVLTDLRSYRADHLVPEDAFPGAVAVTEEELVSVLGDIPMAAAYYVDIDTFDGGTYKDKLVAAAPDAGYDPALITGNISVAFINSIIAELNAAGDPTPLIDPVAAGVKRGIGYADLGKLSLNTSIGSRYFIVKDTFDVLSDYRYVSSDGTSETLMSGPQQEWFFNTIEASDRTWKVWANEFCLVQMAIDLVGEPVPASFQTRFYMNVDAWDGFRNRRSDLLERIGGVENVVAITGDIHAFYAGTPWAMSDPSKKIVEFVGSSMSSKTFKEELVSQVQSDPVLSGIPSASLLASLIDAFLTNGTKRPNPTLAYAESGHNGFCVAEVSAEEFVVTMHQIPSAEVLTDYTGREDELLTKIVKKQFKTVAGEKNLYRYDDATSAWQQWDSAAGTWA